MVRSWPLFPLPGKQAAKTEIEKVLATNPELTCEQALMLVVTLDKRTV